MGTSALHIRLVGNTFSWNTLQDSANPFYLVAAAVDSPRGQRYCLGGGRQKHRFGVPDRADMVGPFQVLVVSTTMDRICMIGCVDRQRNQLSGGTNNSS